MKNSWRSITVLQQECRRWFQSEGLSQPRFELNPTQGWPHKPGVCDIVVARFPEQIIESSCWQARSVRLWAMSHALRNVIVTTTGARPEEIGVLPRDQIFPRENRVRKFPGKNRPWSLVYSGRIHREKGFLLFLRVSSILQMKFGERVQPAIAGMLEDPLIRGASMRANEMSRLLAHLEWTQKPLLWLDCGPYDWTKLELENPVLFNFSVFLREDFGVSAQQAHAKGWPLLLSNWGAHQDIRGSNVFHFDVKSEPVQSGNIEVARRLAARIASRTTLKPILKPTKQSRVQVPLPLQPERIKELRNKLKSYGQFRPEGLWPASFTRDYTKHFTQRSR